MAFNFVLIQLVNLIYFNNCVCLRFSKRVLLYLMLLIFLRKTIEILRIIWRGISILEPLENCIILHYLIFLWIISLCKMLFDYKFLISTVLWRLKEVYFLQILLLKIDLKPMIIQVLWTVSELRQLFLIWMSFIFIIQSLYLLIFIERVSKRTLIILSSYLNYLLNRHLPILFYILN